MAQQLVVPRERARRFDPWVALGWLTIFLMGVTMFGAFIYAPTDRFQGIAQRIFYIHVPSAWLAYLAVFVVFIASILYLVRRSRFWDRVALSSAELGVIFTTLALVTGSLWGRQVWGAWWVWDARLTTTLILWLIYVGYLMLRATMGESPRTARFAAIVGIVGFIDVPIIHQSVKWWRTQHPTPIVVTENPALPASMLIVLVVSVLAFTALYFWLLNLRYRLEAGRDQVAALRRELQGAADV
ncbi:MAG: cytochrome c biogenesis protein CcsA [Chloroflexota bacterium]|nr:cytochrome c biogenesis protein CcsA [Dehalococcoidia bacterium]MDW8253337.1 cytochrome c biogenesis protein CcsA [Chloroflexota bacterium]